MAIEENTPLWHALRMQSTFTIDDFALILAGKSPIYDWRDEEYFDDVACLYRKALEDELRLNYKAVASDVTEDDVPF